MAVGDIGYTTKVGYSDTQGGSYTDFAYGTDVTPPKITSTRVDKTNHDSSNRYRQKRRGFRDAGEVTLKVLFEKTELAAIITLLEEDTDDKWFRVNFPLEDGESTASNWKCQGFLADLQNMNPLDDKMEAEIVICLTGRPVFTQGS